VHSCVFPYSLLSNSPNAIFWKNFQPISLANRGDKACPQ
jgi:hypothetical protein